MTFHSIVPLFALATNLLLIVVVLRKNFQNPANLVFSLFMVSGAVWSFGAFMLRNSATLNEATLWTRFIHIGAITLPIFFLRFSIAFIKKTPPKRLLRPIYIYGAGLMILIPSDLFIKPAFTNIYGWATNPGPAYILYVIFLYALFFLSLHYLLAAHRRSGSAYQRNRINYIVVGIVIYFIGGVIDILPLFGVRIYPIGMITTIVFNCCIAIAIVRYQLMDINLVVKKGLVYSILTVIISGAFIGIIILLEKITSRFLGYQSAISTVLAVILLILTFEPIRRKTQGMLDRVFYGEALKPYETVKEVNKAIVSMLDLDRLLRVILDTVVNTMRFSGGAIMLAEEHSDRFRVMVATGFAGENAPPYVSRTHEELFGLIEREKKILVKEEMEFDATFRRFIVAWDRVFWGLEAEICVPIIFKERLIGIMILGNKISGEMVCHDDLELLRSISNQAAVAIENAKLVENLRRIMQSISEMKRYNDNILESMSDAVITLNPRQKIVMMNRAAEQLFGKGSKEVVGEGFGKILPPSPKNMELSNRLKADSRTQDSFEAEFVNAHGKEIPVFISVSSLTESDHREVGSLIIIRDLSKIRELEKQLMQSEKLASLGQLAAGIAHEINNPLTGILGYTEVLLEDMDEDDPSREDLEIIRDETVRCGKIVKNLLDFARRGDLETEPTNLEDIMEETLQMLQKHVSFQNIKITRLYRSPDPIVRANPNQLRQAFTNIILNAAQAMKERGELTIAINPLNKGRQKGHEEGPENGGIEVAISDTGPGIEKSDLNRIFEPFFTTKEQGRGTGLGLAISYGIIKRHNASISVESEVGKGTTFRIEFSKSRAQDPGGVEIGSVGAAFGLKEKA